jgi:hypothetical protein
LVEEASLADEFGLEGEADGGSFVEEGGGLVECWRGADGTESKARDALLGRKVEEQKLEEVKEGKADAEGGCMPPGWTECLSWVVIPVLLPGD